MFCTHIDYLGISCHICKLTFCNIIQMQHHRNLIQIDAKRFQLFPQNTQDVRGNPSVSTKWGSFFSCAVTGTRVISVKSVRYGHVMCDIQKINKSQCFRSSQLWKSNKTVLWGDLQTISHLVTELYCTRQNHHTQTTQMINTTKVWKERTYKTEDFY